MNKKEIFKELTQKLIDTTTARDDYEIDYELEKARLMVSAEISGLGNQTLRDAELTLVLNEKGMYRKMAELRSQARTAWYAWSSIKSLVDGNVGEE